MRYQPVIVLLVAVLAMLASSAVSATKGTACYVGTWANYRDGNGKFNTSEHLNIDICDHIIYTFVGIRGDTGEVISLDDWLDYGTGSGGTGLRGFLNFTDLKKKNPNLRTSLAIGGWRQCSLNYSIVSNDPVKRRKFIDTAVGFLKEYNFDGFDLDWEYPSQRDGNPVDLENFNTLIREFREEFDKHGYYLSAAVGASNQAADLSYHVPSLSKYLDRIFVMAYDLHGSWDGITGIHAPLYRTSAYDNTNNETLASLYVDNCIRGWLNRGADPEKIGLGMPTYGKSFKLADSSNHNLAAPALPGNGGSAGPYTKESGTLGYNEYCEYKQTTGWTEVWDGEQIGIYAYTTTDWVGLDNQKSLCIKTKYAKDLKLGTTMIWAAETDDFRGVCGTAHPLLSAIKDGLSSNPTLC
ncbi:probable chitinase 2 [Schistocerca gregaria]|uniref:probable chitinase 2 n=1 Tax=Schistocerca gregaria TaxID=7010 RepID=UPI00211F0560|nr:probable chitinase 2 [Schistocerca gregaria]XP_049850794.1 probable chitinase 2 [Schistocerca gregaria]